MIGSGGSIEDQRDSGGKYSDVPSFIEARDPSITNPWMRRRPTHGTNLCSLLEDSKNEEDVYPKVQCIEVYLRIKPVKENVSDVYRLINETTLQTALPNKLSKLYKFTNIFEPAASQKQIFERIVRANIHKLIDGCDYTLLTYGPSGSGKTFTLMGTEAKPGLLPRSLELLFQLIKPSETPRYKPLDGSGVEYLSPSQQTYEMQIQNKVKQVQTTATKTYGRMSVILSHNYEEQKKPETSVWVSYAEIYNETITDLLESPHKSDNNNARLRIVDDVKGNSFIKGLKKVYIQSGKEAYQVMQYGQKNLKYAKTGINAHSSRSHSIFTLMLVKEWPGYEQPTVSTLRLCDLAGSERNKKTGNQGKRLQESCSINMSLYVLERCLDQLRARQSATHSFTSTVSGNMTCNTINSSQHSNIVVPFRESKLTRILSGALSGKENAAMIVNINPQRNCMEETQHVLQFSAIARKLVVNAHTDSGRSSPCTSQSSYDMTAITESIDTLRRENYELKEEINRISSEAEEIANAVAAKREREVRLELFNSMSKLMDKSSEGWQKQLDEEQEHMKQEHAIEMELMKKQYMAVIEELQQEIEELNELNVKKDRPCECSNVSLKKRMSGTSFSPRRDSISSAMSEQMITSLQKELKQVLTKAAIYKEEIDMLKMKLKSSQSNYAVLSEQYVNLEEGTSNQSEVNDFTKSSIAEEPLNLMDDDDEVNDGDDENDSDAMLYNSDTEDEPLDSHIQTVKKLVKRTSLDRSGITLQPAENQPKSDDSSTAAIERCMKTPHDGQSADDAVAKHDGNDNLKHIASYCKKLCESLKESHDIYEKESPAERQMSTSAGHLAETINSETELVDVEPIKVSDDVNSEAVNDDSKLASTEAVSSVEESEVRDTCVGNVLRELTCNPKVPDERSPPAVNGDGDNDSFDKSQFATAKTRRTKKEVLDSNQSDNARSIDKEEEPLNRRITRNTIAVSTLNQNGDENSLTNTGRRKLWTRRMEIEVVDQFIGPERTLGESPDQPLEPVTVTRPSLRPRSRRTKRL